MKNRRSWILLGGIIFLGAAFLFLNFRVASSNTQFEKNIITTGIGNQMPDAMQRQDRISIALVGEGPLVGALQKALAAEIHDAGMGDIEALPGLESAYQNPVLVVKVHQQSLFWTPLFATSQFSIQAGFASSGDISFMGKTPIRIDNKNGPNRNLYGEYKVSDCSWGLITRLGYHRFLADYAALQIVAALKDLYRVS